LLLLRRPETLLRLRLKSWLLQLLLLHRLLLLQRLLLY
jgi:hypothetical protein